jgi:predicted SprT family Zn-dependent metalloprotease
MKITVLNGSPKGKYSITLQYVNLIRKIFPQHELNIFHVSQNIKRLEKDDKVFQEIIEIVNRASEKSVNISARIQWGVKPYHNAN